jgi:hypothetical protein
MKCRIGRSVVAIAGSPDEVMTEHMSSFAAMTTWWPALRAAVAKGASAKTVAGLPAATKSILTVCLPW